MTLYLSHSGLAIKVYDHLISGHHRKIDRYCTYHASHAPNKKLQDSTIPYNTYMDNKKETVRQPKYLSSP